MTAIAVVRSDQIVDKSISSSNKKSDLLGLIVGVIHIAVNSNSEGGGNSDSCELSKESERIEEKDASQQPISPNVCIGRHSKLSWNRASGNEDVVPLEQDEIACIEWSIDGLIETREPGSEVWPIALEQVELDVLEVELGAVMLITMLDPSRFEEFPAQSDLERLSKLREFATLRLSHIRKNWNINMKDVKNLMDWVEAYMLAQEDEEFKEIFKTAVDALAKVTPEQMHKLNFVRPFMQVYRRRYSLNDEVKAAAVFFMIVRSLVPERANVMSSNHLINIEILRFTKVTNKERILNSLEISDTVREIFSDPKYMVFLGKILDKERLKLRSWLLTTAKDLVSKHCRDKVVAPKCSCSPS